MHVSMATAAAHDPNEDFVGAVANAVVLLDGAGIAGTEAICRHGVAWYTHRLGGVLLGSLSRADGHDLVSILGAAIEEVTDAHRGTCDVAHQISPSSTAVIVRLDGDQVDYLVLGDSFLVLDQVGGAATVVTDTRERDLRRPYLTALDAIAPDTAEHDRATNDARQALRALRNQPGGFWLAKDDPQAAAEALTSRRPLGELAGVALMSNGVSRIVDLFGRTDWQGAVSVLRTDGPAALIGLVRAAEAADTSVDPDDATAAYCTWTE